MSIDLFALVSIRTGTLAYAGLTAFFVVGWIRRISGRAALAAAFATTLWFASLDLLGPRPVVSLLEITAYTAWIFLLARVLGVDISVARDPAYRVQTVLAGLAGVLYATSVLFFALAPEAWSAALLEEVPPVAAFLKLGACLLGLVMIEQVFRNTRRDSHWNLKFLSIGLGLVFGYGFVLHSDAALFSTTSFTLFAPQGIVAAAAVPFIAIASMRSRKQQLSFSLSRAFVFRSGILIAAGVYLLAMGTAGYYVRIFGGEWGEVVQVLVVVSGLLGLAVLVASTEVRNRLRVALLRNLYEYKYDYRDEWLRVTRELTEIHADESLAQRAIRALGELVHSPSGRYYRAATQNVLVPIAEVRGARTLPLSPRTSSSLAAFCVERNWIIDIDEYRTSREAYRGLDLEADLLFFQGDRFIVPLLVEDTLIGIVVLGKPMVHTELIWEDYDIMKTVARQAAAFLALQQADQELSESEQLRAMNQMSAFVVHDLKTISAQLSLLLGNAPRHKTNPAFIDDMLKTVENAAGRMNRLLAQLRERPAATTAVHCRIGDAVTTAIDLSRMRAPVPTLDVSCDGINVAADQEQLVNVIAHIIQNAQEATQDHGSVSVTVGRDRGWATIAVRDTGCGMTPEFMESSLFTPFATTKGVAGIGIGAYQSREYLRSIGGDLTARSELGRGSEFVLRIPIPEAHMEAAT